MPGYIAIDLLMEKVKERQTFSYGTLGIVLAAMAHVAILLALAHAHNYGGHNSMFEAYTVRT